MVPVAGDKFQVVFKGKPLAKAKVSVITPSGWAREVHGGDDGTFTVALPWRGPYVFEVQHNDRTPGKRGDEAYDTSELCDLAHRRAAAGYRAAARAAGCQAGPSPLGPGGAGGYDGRRPLYSPKGIAVQNLVTSEAELEAACAACSLATPRQAPIIPTDLSAELVESSTVVG